MVLMRGVQSDSSSVSVGTHGHQWLIGAEENATH